MAGDSIIAIPFRGVGAVRFGMTRGQVESILGSPSSKTMTPGVLDAEWNYEVLGMRLSFDKDYAFRLGRVSLEAPTTQIMGLMPVCLSEQELVDRCKAWGGLVLEDDFNDLGARDYWCEELGASFWVVDGKVERITVFPSYDGDAPVWPVES